QTDRFYAESLSGFENCIPDMFRILVFKVYLETPCTRVACGRYKYIVNPSKLSLFKGIILHRCQVDICQALQSFGSFRSLDSEQRGTVGYIFHFNTECIKAADPVPILLNVGS